VSKTSTIHSTATIETTSTTTLTDSTTNIHQGTLNYDSASIIVDVFDTEMVSDDDATPVVVIPVDVSVGTSVAGYVVVMDVCSSDALYLRST
jgi:hypothetical protein